MYLSLLPQFWTGLIMSWLEDFVGGVAGDLVDGLIGGASAHQSAQHNAALSRENWEYMQSNAHQLEVEDLRKAGLNPILSATNGHIASMPAVNGNVPSTGSINNYVTSGRQLKQQEKLQNRELDIAQTNAETAKAKADTDLYKAKNESKLIDSQIVLNNSNSAYSLKQVDLTAAQINKTNAEISEILQRTQDNHLVSMATIDKLRSGVALDYATASKMASDVEKNAAEAGLYGVQKDQIIRILTDPRAEMDRKMWADAMEGRNALGIVHQLGVFGNEFNSIFPSRVGVSLGKFGK